MSQYGSNGSRQTTFKEPFVLPEDRLTALRDGVKYDDMIEKKPDSSLTYTQLLDAAKDIEDTSTLTNMINGLGEQDLSFDERQRIEHFINDKLIKILAKHNEKVVSVNNLRFEINKLQTASDAYKHESERVYAESLKATDRSAKQALVKESNRLDNMHYKIDEKIAERQRIGLAAKDERNLLKEASNFINLKTTKMLGDTLFTSVGFSKTLGEYVEIDYNHYSQFMHNVRGMGSLAGKKSLSSFKVITKPEYDERLTQNRVHETSFMGMNEKKVISPSGELIK